MIGVYCAQTVVAGAVLVFVVTLALDLLDLGRSGVGYLDAVMGIGGLVGGFVALVLAQRGRLALDFEWACCSGRRHYSLSPRGRLLEWPPARWC